MLAQLILLMLNQVYQKVDASIVVKTVRDLLYDPEKKAERAQMATSNVDDSLGNLFAEVRCCITALVYLNTLIFLQTMQMRCQ